MPEELKKKDLSISDIEKIMLEETQVIIPVKHSFSKGIYAREICIKQGTILIGHKHKEPCMNILAQGVMVLKRDMEDEGTLIKAPYTFHTEPGSQKMAICLEDAVFINIFKTEETDLEKLDELLIQKSQAYLDHETRKPIKRITK